MDLLRLKNPLSDFVQQDIALNIEPIKAVLSLAKAVYAASVTLSLTPMNIEPLVIAGLKVSMLPEVLVERVGKKGEPVVDAIPDENAQPLNLGGRLRQHPPALDGRGASGGLRQAGRNPLSGG